MKQSIGKNYWPHVVAIISFLVISFYYFSPLLDGKELVGHDTESFFGMYQEAKIYNETHDEPTLWTNSMFGGMPTYQIGMPRPTSALTILTTPMSIFPRTIYTLLAYLIGFYILLICLGVNPWLSIACSFAFAFGSYNFIILAVGHNTKALAIAYMAPLIASVIVSFRKNKWIGSALCAVFLALAISANHLQILYYTFIALVIYGISEVIYGIIEKRLKDILITLGLLIVAAAIAVGLNATLLLTTKEYSEYTMRGKSNGLSTALDKDSHQDGLNKDYITQWSYDIDETMTLLIPNYKGGASQEKLSATSNTAAKLREMNVQDVDNIMQTTPMPTYWGTQPYTSGPVYVGAIVCFLFVLGLFLVNGRNKWWLLAVTIIAIMLSWGKNFMPLSGFFIKYIPMYNMFRAVSMTLVLAAFSMTVMAALALKQVFNSEINKEKKTKALYISAGIVGGISLIFALIPSLAGNFKNAGDAMLTSYGFPEFITKTLPMDRADLLRSDAFRSFIFIALTFGVLWYWVNKTIKPQIIYAALAVLFLADMVPVAKRYLNKDNFQEKHVGEYFTPSNADKSILRDHSDYRVLDITVDVFNSSKPAYFHKCIGGYHAAKLRRYQELINTHLTREISNIGASFQSAQKAQSLEPVTQTLMQSQVLNMLNMKYLIFNPQAEPLVNPFANGNAWFVNTCHITQTPDEEMLKLGSINTKKELVADKEYTSLIPKQIQPDTTAKIALTSYAPNDLKYKSESKTDQVAVFSEIYYDKGWNAYVDGKLTPYFRANYLLRALPIKAGAHEIEFRFEPKSYSNGNTIADVSSILLALTLGGVIFFEYKKRKTKV